MNSEKEIFKFLDRGVTALRGTEVSDRIGGSPTLLDGIQGVVRQIVALPASKGTLTFVGNGGSAAIASHQATDFIRTCKIRAYAPLDPSLLTCLGNDCGYENVFAESLKVLARKNDILVAISSSGKSQNILNAVDVAREKGCLVVTMSGFGADNPLRLLGDLNFYVASDSYRIVESAHLFICNWILESTIHALQK